MDRLEAMLWISEMDLARQGNEGAQKRLDAANKLRRENNRPTIEEELQALLES